jgi:hypothetical protein
VNSIEIHREAAKERQQLPAEVALAFAEIEEALLLLDVHASGLAHKREQGWGRRMMLVGHASHRGTTYRMAWEVVSRREVAIWAYGPHEGFYPRLARRARQ